MKTPKSKKQIGIDQKNISNFLFEVGILAKTPRSGFYFLGTGNQSVAEHVNRTLFVAYALGLMDGTVDMTKIMKMALFHDITETRISDLNHVHQRYVDRKEHSAVKDISDSVPFGNDMFEILGEYEKRASPEAILVKDADTLEWILCLKEQVDTGNNRALGLIAKARVRLKTPYAKQLVLAIMDTDSKDWWFENKKDQI